MQVRVISSEQHLAYIDTRPAVSFLQTPAWAKVKSGWMSQSLGWFVGDQLVGAGLVLLRKVPKVERYLAYIPEGPDLNWQDTTHVEQALSALTDYLGNLGVFQIKMGPRVWTRRWESESIKTAIAQEVATSLTHIQPSHINATGLKLAEQMAALGWKQPHNVGAGFGDYQPRYVFQIPLAGRTEEDLLTGFNQLWRRNIKKSEKAGVTVRLGEREDLADFHQCYVETAKRDNFSPRPLSYFHTMWDAMRAEDPKRLRLYLAHHPDHPGVIAATTMTSVGNVRWYSYGASTTAARDLRPSNAIQWHMMRDSLAEGADVYDLRGISDTIDPTDPLFGLIQFKLGTGGYAQEYVGEWDFVLSPIWAKAFNLYMARK